MKKFLFWSPRILSIAFVIFVSIFSLDVFGTNLKGWEMIVVLIYHLFIPLILLIFTVVAWKKDLIGTITFFLFALYYIYMVGFDRHWSWYVSIPLPALITSALFFFNWKHK